MQTQSLSLQFIAEFNKLDKYLEDILSDHGQRMNFGHKLKLISHWEYSMSYLVTSYFYELNYLGDLRNQLVHGLWLDEQYYVVPTDHAMTEIKRLSSLIINHLDHECKVLDTDLVSDVVSCMIDRRHGHVLVYRDGQYYYDLTWQRLIWAMIYHEWTIIWVSLNDLALQKIR